MGTKIALIGIGGWGKFHVNQISSLVQDGLLDCIAFAEIRPELHKDSYDQLTAMGARHYSDYKELLQAHGELDFVVITAPIHLHQPMALYAIERGIHVMMEKPPTATVQDLDTLLEAKRANGTVCTVHFQHTSGRAFRHMLKLIQEGAIGELVSVTGIGTWKRTNTYYERTPWAGKIMHNGAYVMDGSIHNPLAHLFQNCLVAAGKGDPEAACPEWVTAELYKGHEIETEDTSCVRISTRNGVAIHYYSTLCHDANLPPHIRVKGTKGELVWNYNNELTWTDENKVEHPFRHGSENLSRNMYLNMIDAVKGETQELYCSLEACRSFMVAANGAFASSGRIHPVPSEHVDVKEEKGEVVTTIRDVVSTIHSAAEKGLLYSELGIAWGASGHKLDTRDFRRFGLDLMQ
ncbi:Gfo/Idh/MocA family oxidoreductase [Paenibacillus sp. GD4]|uniref:Gfo/Idh/MocA family protein n=1 Tax=Paenibacillus sp. GD4 TaxID=3068890 RepID=UPI002796D9D4|nr:Gfo/Idh/MocA family oxidoreductase [Paenibacillus sp. GD4]MDQ1912771.1 Gfo/Idh/MocA family oxidoreductase [Paenibacillus sp. GD4]